MKRSIKSKELVERYSHCKSKREKELLAAELGIHVAHLYNLVSRARGPRREKATRSVTDIP